MLSKFYEVILIKKNETCIEYSTFPSIRKYFKQYASLQVRKLLLEIELTLLLYLKSNVLIIVCIAI